jgi:hypothetical protein
VHNLEDTVSINHNWVNAANAAGSWQLLQSMLAEVKAGLTAGLDDLDDDVMLAQLLRRRTGAWTLLSVTLRARWVTLRAR